MLSLVLIWWYNEDSGIKPLKPPSSRYDVTTSCYYVTFMRPLYFRFRHMTLRYDNKLCLCYVALRHLSFCFCCLHLVTLRYGLQIVSSCVLFRLHDLTSYDNTPLWQYSLLCDILSRYFALFVHQGYEVLSKYVALYAANLIKDGNTLKALDLFCRYGAPANPQVNSLQLLLYQETFIFWLSCFLSLFSSTILNLVNISNSR